MVGYKAWHGAQNLVDQIPSILTHEVWHRDQDPVELNTTSPNTLGLILGSESSGASGVTKVMQLVWATLADVPLQGDAQKEFDTPPAHLRLSAPIRAMTDTMGSISTPTQK